jgi:hypothetical protein
MILWSVEAALRLHGIAGHDLIGVCDEAIGLFLVPTKSAPFIALELRAGGNSSGRKSVAFHLAYLPLVSTFCFSSSFIFFTMGSRLASPVV